MKTSSKIYFTLGVLATIGVIATAYYIKKNVKKSPSELLEDGEKFIKDISETIQEEVESAIDEKLN